MQQNKSSVHLTFFSFCGKKKNLGLYYASESKWCPSKTQNTARNLSNCAFYTGLVGSSVFSPSKWTCKIVTSQSQGALFKAQKIPKKHTN